MKIFYKFLLRNYLFFPPQGLAGGPGRNHRPERRISLVPPEPLQDGGGEPAGEGGARLLPGPPIRQLARRLLALLPHQQSDTALSHREERRPIRHGRQAKENM